jgi:hypothetical protein
MSDEATLRLAVDFLQLTAEQANRGSAARVRRFVLSEQTPDNAITEYALLKARVHLRKALRHFAEKLP